jgi:outer membrane lipopolysaccharide assembly protein LptE/RlpB
MKTLGAVAIVIFLLTAGCGYHDRYARRDEIRRAQQDFRRAGWEARQEMQRARRDLQREMRDAREEFRREMREAHRDIRRDLRDQFDRRY